MLSHLSTLSMFLYIYLQFWFHFLVSLPSAKLELLKTTKLRLLVAACTLDIALVLDHSGSVGNDSWLSLIEFLVTFVSALEIGAQQTRIAAVSFGMQ